MFHFMTLQLLTDVIIIIAIVQLQLMVNIPSTCIPLCIHGDNPYGDGSPVIASPSQRPPLTRHEAVNVHIY